MQRLRPSNRPAVQAGCTRPKAGQFSSPVQGGERSASGGERRGVFREAETLRRGGPHKRHVLTANAVGNAAQLRQGEPEAFGFPRSGNRGAEDRRHESSPAGESKYSSPARKKKKMGEAFSPSTIPPWRSIPSPGTRTDTGRPDRPGKNSCSASPRPGFGTAGQN